MDKLVLVAGLCLTVVSLASSFKRVCYVATWSKDRDGPVKFHPRDVDVNLCSHLIVAFAHIRDSKLVLESSADMDFLADLASLKKKKNDLKVLLAVGGEGCNTTTFTDMASTAENRGVFIKSCIDFLRKNDLDGISLDWQFPGEANKNKFTSLCQEFRNASESEANETANTTLLITAAVAANKVDIDSSYEIKDIDMCLDFMTVMTYDFYEEDGGAAIHHSTLFEGPSDSGAYALRNSKYAMMYWKSKGASAEKLLMGIAAYGRTFTLASANSTGIGAPTTGPGAAGTYTKQAGFLSYYEIHEHFKGKHLHWSDKQKVPYGAKGTLWVGFDNKDSIETKVQFIQDNGFGGASAWSLDLDDFNNKFWRQGKYPLISHMKPVKDTVKTPDPKFCRGKVNGSHAVKGLPQKFYTCSNGITYIQNCPATLVFKESNKMCGYV